MENRLMTEGFRSRSGGRIHRGRKISFQFNGRRYEGFPGDTLASALIANGVSVVGRSQKYHRPRGIMSAGLEETNAIVQLAGNDDEPNRAATTLPIYDGLVAHSVNVAPSVDFDLGSLLGFFHRFIPAGFYYKTFMWPKDRWDWYGGIIRKVAGWGTAPAKPGGGRYEHRNHHCDVLIVGAGPAGLSAALSAGRTGSRILLVDSDTEPGGKLLSDNLTIRSCPAMEWVDDIVAELDLMPNIIRLTRATATGYFADNYVTVIEECPDKPWIRERLWKVRAKQVILATGAIERTLLFANNDRPGIMLASAAMTYCSRYGVRPGNTAVVFTNNNSGYRYAIGLLKAGVSVTALIDTRKEADSRLRAAAAGSGIEVIADARVVSATGRRRVSAVNIVSGNDQSPRRIRCDLVAVSGGWNPAIHLHSQSGGKPIYNQRIASFVPGESKQNERSVGACRGELTLQSALAEGANAGYKAAALCGFALADIEVPDCEHEPEPGVDPVWDCSQPGGQSSAFIDFNNDVTSADIRLAMREGYRSVELVKRYTTAGMGIDQGKSSSVSIVGLIAEIAGLEPGSVGTTTYRPAYTPVSFGAMAGPAKSDLIVPWRRTPVTDWFLDNGGHLDETGAQFRRPLFIAKADESAGDAVQREALAVRNQVGIYDSTPLGKILIQGPDAVAFLNRVYSNNWENLPVGRGKFGFMLHEDGRLLDDGVTMRISDNQYWMSNSAGMADVVLDHLDRLLHIHWPELKVYLTPITDQWAVVCVCGPHARDVLYEADIDIDISGEAFRFLDTRLCTIGGLSARISRVTYTGELSFEIAVPMRHGLRLWNILIAAGQKFGITPVGSDTSMLLRTEKGFIAAGLEGDGYADIFDVGMGWLVPKEKADFVGKRSLEKNRRSDGGRPEVVGLLPDNSDFVPPKGAPLVEYDRNDEVPQQVGMVTIGFFSPNLGRSIALAQLRDGRSRMGQSATIYTKAGVETATICEPVFIDPDGERMRD
jgi:sarcosine oxidase subunit alpha